MSNVIKIIFVLIGTLIGAGFASGQEIYIFFFFHGINGIYGIIVSSISMGGIIYATLNILEKHNIQNYKEFLDKIIQNNKINNYINIIVNIFILITFIIMIAGCGAYFSQNYGINTQIGSTILAILCFFTFLNNVEGLVKVNEFLVPILILFIMAIGILNIQEIDLLNITKYIPQNNNFSWLLNSIIYCSYNTILLIPTLITLKKYIKNQKQNKCIAAITSLITIILSIAIYTILINVDVDIKNLEMPAVYVIVKLFPKLKSIYGIIILASIYTTSISLGVSFLKNTAKTQKSSVIIAFLICIAGILVSNIGFTNLINSLYPLFGYLGLIQIYKIIKYNHHAKKKYYSRKKQ